MWVLRLRQLRTTVLNSLKAVVAAITTNYAPAVLSKLYVFAAASHSFLMSRVAAVPAEMRRKSSFLFFFLKLLYLSASVRSASHRGCRWRLLAVVKESLTQLTASHNCSICVEGRKVNPKKLFPRNKSHLFYFIFFEQKSVTDMKFGSRRFPTGPRFPEYKLHLGRKP